MGVRFEVLSQNADEQLHPDETPEVFAIRLALEKARAGLGNRPAKANAPVLGADTVVVIDDDILGKPADQNDAMATLARLSGQTHRVLTGVALVTDGYESTRLSLSSVTLREISEQECVDYWLSQEPIGKAGAYAIQGRGGVFVEQLEGSYSGVMGLPMFETDDLLKELGIHYQSRWPSDQ
jgi:septum formation protein